MSNPFFIRRADVSSLNFASGPFSLSPPQTGSGGSAAGKSPTFSPKVETFGHLQKCSDSRGDFIPLAIGIRPEPGRVTRGFENNPRDREWQAEQILKRFGQWPPPEGEIFVLQIDQDSPPPPPPRPALNSPPQKFGEQTTAWKKGLEELQRFTTQYTGQTVVFQPQRVDGRLRLVELNPKGPFRSASHAGQLWGDVSCNNGVCGMAWLRPGIYPYKGRTWGVFNPVQDSLMDVARDINGDGAIDHQESVRSSRAHGFGIQIHPGFPASPQSTGCQTFQPSDFNELQKILIAAKVNTFSYVLVRRPNEKNGPYAW